MFALRAVSIPLTAAIVLAGLWLAGGLITNDFEVAMLLTVLWMGVAGLAALAIGIWSRSFRWPVIGAYVVTALVVGVYLGRSVFMDNVVNEQVAIAAPAPPASRSSTQSSEPRNVLLRAGTFESVRHAAGGKAMAIE